MSAVSPPYPQEPTSSVRPASSEKCQRATSTRSRSVRSGGGDRKLKERTPRLAPGRPQPPTMGFDDRAADREAHAHAVGPRRVEWLEQTQEALRAQPRAVVPHPDAHATFGRNGIDADL